MKRALLATLLSLAAAHASAVIVVHTSDFIDNGTRAGFNGFESIPNDGTFYTGGSNPYSEDGVTVQQINGDSGNDIWIDYNFWSGALGKAWYPNGGDHGYTKITLTGGSDFSEVGFNVGSGGSASQTVYELFNNGVFVFGGNSSVSSTYIGFSGGGFDTIFIRDNLIGDNFGVMDGSYQALAIDNIETRGGASVPEPASLALLSLGLVGLGFSRRKS